MGWGPGDGALGMDETNVILLKSAGWVSDRET
jgi:hypothetical protein